MDITLSQEQYEALVALAQRSTVDPDGSLNQERSLTLQRFLTDLEKANGITRYSLWVRWQDPTAPLPPGVRFPATWPPELQYFIQFITRPIAKTDVLSMVKERTPNALNILVTPDPAGLVGWCKIDDFFTQP
jgi:hypothetical protein